MQRHSSKKKKNRPFKLKYVAVGEENLGKEMHPAVKNYSMTLHCVGKLKTRGPEHKICLFEKINKSLVGRGSRLLLSEVWLVNTNTQISCISSNFIIQAGSKTRIGYNSE